ncbi:MAG: cytochrome c biogenesis CcdA family protein [Arachnia sp.]
MEIGLAGAFLGGLAALLSPCSAMLLPSFFAVAFSSRTSALVGRVTLFYLGLLLTLVPLGLAAGALGSLVTTHRDLLALVGGGVLITMGILMIFDVPLPGAGLRVRGGTGAVAVVLLGAAYGLAGACTGPLLGAVLTMAAVGSSPIYGGLLLAVFGAGMAVPLLVLALLWDRLRIAERLTPRPVRIGPLHTTLWGVIAGLVFVGLGVLFLTTDATTALGGVLDARTQLGIEATLGRWAQAIPDIAAIMGLAALAGAVVWLARDRGPSS